MDAVGRILSVRVGKVTEYERRAWDHVQTRPYATAFRKAEVAGTDRKSVV